MEHLHFMLKMVLESLLGHIMQRSAQRVASSLGTIDRVMDGIQKEMGLKKEPGHHKIKDPEQAVTVIATDPDTGSPKRCGLSTHTNGWPVNKLKAVTVVHCTEP